MAAIDYIRENRDRILEELVAFASIPSVSTDPAYAEGMTRAADWVAACMHKAGLGSIQINPTGGHAVVTGAWTGAPGAPTILVYGHYDVQPPDPLGAWKSPPFQPKVRDGRLYGRGVSDDKGPVLIPLKVAEAYMATAGRLPVNVKFVIEGEEESGSPHLGQFVRAHTEDLKADFVLSADGAMWRPDEPSITVASRGMATLEFTLRGAAKDLHSGRHGGGVANPLQALARLAASLHDDRGHIAVNGFYDRVRPLDPAAKAMVTTLPFDEDAYLKSVGAPGGYGEAGYSLLERQWLRPTLELNGLWGGYQGPGSKTVIPAEAHAKISCRLVPEQDPEEIIGLIAAHLRKHRPPGVRLEVTPGHGSRAYAIPDDHPGLALAEEVLEEVYHQPALRVRMGATVPIGLLFRNAIGAETVFFSFSTADEDYHAPNEFFRLKRLDEGLAAWTRYWQLLGERGMAGLSAGSFAS
jgi:acetylornithine deacetylase/succinyl-diaminopimelate desuccinylase-like protein